MIKYLLVVRPGSQDNVYIENEYYNKEIAEAKAKELYNAGWCTARVMTPEQYKEFLKNEE